MKNIKYIAKIGSIIYAIIKIQVGFTFATFMISQFIKNSNSEHFNAIDQILQYFARSLEKSVTFKNKKFKIN